MGAAGPSRVAVIVQTGQGLCNLQGGWHCPEPVCVFGGCSWASCEVLVLIALYCQRPAASTRIDSRMRIVEQTRIQFGKGSMSQPSSVSSARHSLFTPRGGHEDKASHWLACSLMVGQRGGIGTMAWVQPVRRGGPSLCRWAMGFATSWWGCAAWGSICVFGGRSWASCEKLGLIAPCRQRPAIRTGGYE